MVKIQIAEESYGLVDRYLRKLDQELHKFQLELEADNRGITEVRALTPLTLLALSTLPTLTLLTSPHLIPLISPQVLEKRSLELDAPASRPSSFMKENRLPKKLKVTPAHHTTTPLHLHHTTSTSLPLLQHDQQVTPAHHTTIAHTPQPDRPVGRPGIQPQVNNFKK